MLHVPPVRILIVEDEFLIRMMVSEALADEGFVVIEAATGDEALGLLQHGTAIEVMLTDVSLPGSLDGLALAEQARRILPDLPIVFVTGRPDVIVASALHGRDALVAKPYLPSEITAAIRALLGQ